MKQHQFIKDLKFAIDSVFKTLNSVGLVTFYEPCISSKASNDTRIGWANHQSREELKPEKYTSLIQYKAILKSRAFNAILVDGSIIRVSYLYSPNQKLLSYTHLWYPCPTPQVILDICSDDENMDLVEILLNYLDTNIPPDDVVLRSPIRFDYDVSNDSEFHPANHLHIQHHDCRLLVNGLLCTSCFVKLISKYCYPDNHGYYSIDDNLDCIKCVHKRENNNRVHSISL